MAIDRHNVPHPDIKVPRWREDFYETRPRAGVAETWLVDLEHGELLVHTDPQPNGYANVHAPRRGDTARPGAFPKREVDVASILG